MRMLLHKHPQNKFWRDGGAAWKAPLNPGREESQKFLSGAWKNCILFPGIYLIVVQTFHSEPQMSTCSTKSSGFILWGPQMAAPNVMAIHATVYWDISVWAKVASTSKSMKGDKHRPDSVQRTTETTAVELNKPWWLMTEFVKWEWVGAKLWTLNHVFNVRHILSAPIICSHVRKMKLAC